MGETTFQTDTIAEDETTTPYRRAFAIIPGHDQDRAQPVEHDFDDADYDAPPMLLSASNLPAERMDAIADELWENSFPDSKQIEDEIERELQSHLKMVAD